jgi:hypothetical protein
MHIQKKKKKKLYSKIVFHTDAIEQQPILFNDIQKLNRQTTWNRTTHSA